MHPFVLIPLFACVGASAAASAIMARDSSARSNRLGALLLACGAAWALLQLLWSLETDRDHALILMRALGFAVLPIGPLSLDLCLEYRGSHSRRMRRGLSLVYASVPVAAAAAALTPWMVADATPTAWGFTGVPGPAAWAIGSLVFIPALLLATVTARAALRPVAGGALQVAGILTLVALGVTKLTLPDLALGLPHLGPAAIAALGALLWIRSFGAGGELTPSAFAREILDSLGEGVVLVSGTRVRAVNQSFATMVGQRGDELLGQSIDVVLPALPGAPARSGAHVEEFETGLRLASGAEIPASVSISTLRDLQGGAIGEVLVVRDEREVVELRRHLVTSARLAAAGELAAGIAHEVNNPIAFIQANLNQLDGHFEELASRLSKRGCDGSVASLASRAREEIQGSLSDLRRVVSIVRDVRGFAHGGVGARSSEDLNQLVESALRLSSLQEGALTEVERRYESLPPVSCAGQELKQAFLNLMVRVGEAAGEGDVIAVSTARIGDDVVVAVELRTDADATRDVDLSLARELVARSGAELDVLAPGGGIALDLRVRLASVLHPEPQADS